MILNPNGAFLIAAADVLLAASFVFQKLYGSKKGNTILAGTVFLLITGIVKTAFFALLCLFAKDGSAFFAPFTLALAAGKELLCLIYTLIGFLLLAKGGMTLYTLFLMTGGMTLPYLYGVLFLHEELTVLRSVGLVLIILSTALYNLDFGKDRSRLSARVWLLCGAVFVLNGFVSILSKMHQVETAFPTAGTFGFAFWSALSGVFFTFFLCAALQRKYGKAELSKAFGIKTDMRFVLTVSAFAACAGGFSYLLQLFGAELLPATVLYPAVTGGSILCSALADKLIFRTRLAPLQWFGLLLAVTGTCLFL